MVSDILHILYIIYFIFAMCILCFSSVNLFLPNRPRGAYFVVLSSAASRIGRRIRQRGFRVGLYNLPLMSADLRRPRSDARSGRVLGAVLCPPPGQIVGSLSRRTFGQDLSLAEYSCEEHHVCAFSPRPHIQLHGSDLSGRQFTARCKVLPRHLCSKLSPEELETDDFNPLFFLYKGKSDFFGALE